MSNYYIYNGVIYSDNELRHWGIKGMKWGVRRYQNKDGSLTELGKKRVLKDSDMVFYNYRRKERKLRAPTVNRENMKNDERLEQAKEEYRKIAVQERDRLLQERTTLQKSGYKFADKPDSDLQEHNTDILNFVISKSPAIKAAQKAFTEVEVSLFADALIADFGLKNTEKAKAFVTEAIIANNALVRTNLGLNDDNVKE